MRLSGLLAAAGLACLFGAGAAIASAQQSPAHSHGPAPRAAAPAGVRITMDALHAAGGVPPGWRFSVPAGDPAAGRRAFVDLKCHACHAVKGEQFPLKPGEAATAGPDLTGMGQRHPAEYLAESIVNPNAVLVEGPGYIGGDGRSIMPASPQMTMAQLVDVVAYLKGLGGGHDHDAGGRDAPVQEAGRYRVRLRYAAAAPTASDHAHQGHGGAAGHDRGQGGQAKAGRGHLMVFVSDRATGQPVPYLPVRARIEVPGRSPRTMALAPQLGAEGFHYGASADVPAAARRIVLSVGAATARLLPGEPGAFAGAHTVTFDWR